MSKKISIIVISIIIVISLAISIYLPNRDRIEENEDLSINYEIIEKDGKIGVTKNKQVVIEPQYEEVIIPNKHRAVFFCENKEKQKIVNEENEEIFKKYDNVEPIEIYESKYEANILKYKHNNKYGLLSITGKVITKAKYEEITGLGYKENEVLVKENTKYGILTANGNQKIKCNYDKIQADEYYTQENGYKKSGYIVQKTTEEGYRYGYYDSEGSKVLKEEFNQITRITQIESEDIYLIASKNGQYGVYLNNSKIINTQYQMIEYNSDLEIFIVERTGKYGAINIKGVEILKPEYNELQINGIYIYTVKGEEKQVWDINGKKVEIPFETIIQKTNSEYFIKSEEGNYSIINSKFEPISKQNYKYLEFAYDNYFIATNEQDKTGIIDAQENIILDFKYDTIQVVRGKYAIQAIDFTTNKTGIYNKNINLTIELEGASIEYLEKGFKVYNEEQEIFLNDEGKLVSE